MIGTSVTDQRRVELSVLDISGIVETKDLLCHVDWDAHKALCKALLSGPTVQAIFLPFDSDMPKVVPVATATEFMPEPGNNRSLTDAFFHGAAGLKIYLGSKGGHERVVINNAGDPSAKRLEHRLQIYMRENFLADGSPTNRCTRALVPEGLKYDWRGNLVIFKTELTNSDLTSYVDASLEDLEDIKEWLKWYGPGIDTGIAVEWVDGRLVLAGHY
ncbi:hypothetical protein K488DRAFT_67630 [Vararia minispora EC-137]|uniref:Uncharacterized protein n=1 Tax=Vararia minispora EC-137 TaxID=1314806 RepID=A0ACB8QY13_9AGAM|nr:hypothetical protein K488DRAFT_67630 [Vararia minispora EC-137]